MVELHTPPGSQLVAGVWHHLDIQLRLLADVAVRSAQLRPAILVSELCFEALTPCVVAQGAGELSVSPEACRWRTHLELWHALVMASG